jgi:hypothetical protein
MCYRRPPRSAAGRRQEVGLVNADAAADGYVGVAASAVPNIVGAGPHLQDRGSAVGTASSAAPYSGCCADCSVTGAATVRVVSTSYEGQYVCPHRGG